jgi:hypothetical protein
MFIDLNAQGVRMKLVYELARALERDPQLVRQTQTLTLDASRPQMGLRGNCGLFATDDWWKSIQSGRLRSRSISGVIETTHFAGQDSRWGDQVNGFQLLLDDGARHSDSIYALEKADRKLFIPGARVTMVFVLDEMKQQPAIDGGVNYLDIVLEVAVSTDSARKMAVHRA